jgi:hypothetical protein
MLSVTDIYSEEYQDGENSQIISGRCDDIDFGLLRMHREVP